MAMKRKNYTYRQIVEIASKNYPDQYPLSMLHKGKFSHAEADLAGDTLARFIAGELSDTFLPKASRVEQLEEASRVMGKAAMQLDDVWNGINMELNIQQKLEKCQNQSRSRRDK